MKHKLFSLMLLMALALLSVACTAQQASGASNDTSAAPDVQDDGVEDQADLIAALRAVGAEVEPGDTIEQAFFSVPGQILKVNGADVQVFEYESAEAMGTEASQVSEDGSSIGTSMVSWVAPPHFFRSGRVLVLYVGDDDAVLDLLEGALAEQFAGR